MKLQSGWGWTGKTGFMGGLDRAASEERWEQSQAAVALGMHGAGRVGAMCVHGKRMEESGWLLRGGGALGG